GLERVARALDLASELGEEWYVSRLYHVRADLLLHACGANNEAAEASLQQAVAIARRQDAKGWERDEPSPTSGATRASGLKARELLAPIYDWFNEGFETSALKEAKALLEQLQV